MGKKEGWFFLFSVRPNPGEGLIFRVYFFLVEILDQIVYHSLAHFYQGRDICPKKRCLVYSASCLPNG